MGRKRSGSTRKGRGRKGSSNNSKSSTPVSTSFAESAAASTVSGSSAYATPDPSSPIADKDAANRLDKDDTENMANGKEPQMIETEEDLDTGTADRAPTSDEPKDAEKKDIDAYNIEFSLASEAEAPSTEDQLDELYVRAPKDIDGENQTTATSLSTGRPRSPSVAIEGDESFVPTARIMEANEGVANSRANVQASVNMEDSQAELLSSNLEDSMYRSALRNAGPSVNDEVHSLESSEALQPSAARTHSQRNRNDDDDDFEYMSANNFKTDKLDDSITRSYVITPGAFADENEPEVVTHIRPESATDRQESSDRRETTSEKPGQQHVQDILGSSMTESYVNVDANESIRSSKARQAVKDTMDSAKENAKNAANKADKAASDAKNAAGNAADKAAGKSKEAADNVADAAHDASSRAKGMLDSASKSVKDAASTANDKAHDAIHKARESGERFAKKAREEANEAEKAVRKHADETSPVTLRVMGIVAAALAAVSGYHYRLPGAQNQRIGFAGAVASAIIGLGTLATAFIRRNNN